MGNMCQPPKPKGGSQSQAPAPQSSKGGKGNVKVYGLPPSANACSPILLAMDLGAGGLEMCDITKGEQLTPEFLAMNPFHHIPTMKDGNVALGESIASLRYLAMKYKPAYYPVSDPNTVAWLDFAMESFAGDVYKPWTKIVYPLFGFAGPTEDKVEANKTLQQICDTWTNHFLKGKFVNGDSLTVADFKVAPFFFALCQPGVEHASGFTASDRVKQYVEDFCAATPASEFLKSQGGFSIAEFAAAKAEGAPTTAKPFSAPSIPGRPETAKSSGKVQVFALAPSPNCVGPILMAMESKVGGMEVCNLGNGEHMTESFLAMNPFHHIPTLKDGDFAIGESSASLRYMALKYKPEYYPTKNPAATGMIDFAIEAFGGDVYPKFCAAIYPVLGFAGPPDDKEKAVKELNEMFDLWTGHFLKKKFVNGDSLSIADFRVAPFAFACCQPGVEKMMGFKPSARLQKYVADFQAACKSSSFLTSADGSSIGEVVAAKNTEVMV